VVEDLLGLRRRGDRLTVVPCLPAAWSSFEITYRFGTTTYRIRVENPSGSERNGGEVWLDGRPCPSQEIMLTDDGQPHEVRVRVGPTLPTPLAPMS
jgi:cellobiose phosphorylase